MKDQILKFEPRRQPPRSQSGTRPTVRGKERGVSERTVARCIQSIQTAGLDLDACVALGGAWAVAARRVQASQVAARLDSLRDRRRIAPHLRLTVITEDAEAI